MEKDLESLIEELAQEKLGGRSYGEIRAELKESGMSPDEISALIRQVDEKVLAAAVSEAQPDKGRMWYRIGLFLALVGLALSIAFNAGLLLQRLPPLAVYTPFLAGILLMFYGKLLQKRKPDTEQKGPGPIRKKRPYK
jgi:hypothetical protein